MGQPIQKTRNIGAAPTVDVRNASGSAVRQISLPAAITACEAADAGLSRVVSAIRDVGGALVVIADHGNAEMMRDPATGGPHTAHTTNPVPVVVLGAPAGTAVADGRLADVAPTLLDLLGLEQPVAMTGHSLLR